MDRRTFRRFSLMLPVLFRWADGLEHYDVGRCGNAGLGGVFVLTAKCPPVGMEVEVELDVPAFDLVPHEVRLRCVGRVSRIETCYQVSGFAVVGQLVKEALSQSVSRVTAS